MSKLTCSTVLCVGCQVTDTIHYLVISRIISTTVCRQTLQVGIEGVTVLPTTSRIPLLTVLFVIAFTHLHDSAMAVSAMNSFRQSD